MTDFTGVSTAAGLHNDIFRRNVVAAASGFIWGGGNTFFITTPVDVPILLPPALDWPGEELYFKRIGNGSNIAQLIADGADTFENESGFNVFTMAFKNEYVKIKSDGVGTWYAIERRTFCGAGMSLTPPDTFNVTSTPTKLNVFNNITATTRTRCEANLTTQTLDVLEIQQSTGDFYDIRFSGSFEYTNNANLHLQVYCDGVPIPELQAADQGNGPGDNASFGMALHFLITVPCSLELRISGSSASVTTVNGLGFEAVRSGG